MRINTNVAALNTHRILGQTNDAAARSIGRLSSGFRINSAKDDAAGLAIANKFRADIRSLRVAQQNTTEANAMLQVAEGNASTISEILDRMKELATQAASFNSDSQLATLDAEFQDLKAEIDRIVDSAKYQNTGLLDGNFDGTFQIGATNIADNTIEINLTTGAGGGGGGPTVTGLFDTEDTGISSLVLGSVEDVSGELNAGTYKIGAVDDGAGEVTFTLLDSDDNAVTGVNSPTADTTGTGAGSVVFTLNGKTIATLAYDDVTEIDAGEIDGQDLFEVTAAVGGGGGGGGAGLGTAAIGVDASDLTSAANAQNALDQIDTAIDTVNSFLGKIGATQNRLDYAAANIATTIENYSASESAIRDADMAFEMTTFMRNQIMQQAATAMLAQANMAPQSILQLLG